MRQIFADCVREAGLGVPAFAANDVNLGALAEHRHGAGRGARDLLLVATGHRGVGGALVLDGHLHTGSSGLALEVGHLTVNPEGRPCHCGSRGCLDVEADPLAFLTAAGRAPDPGGSLLEQARGLLTEAKDDPDVRAATALLIDRLGLGLAGLVNILNPDRIVLGGLHRTLLDADPERLRAVVADRSLWGRSGSVPILASTLDHNSLVGAAELAWQPVLDDPLGALSGGDADGLHARLPDGLLDGLPDRLARLRRLVPARHQIRHERGDPGDRERQNACEATPVTIRATSITAYVDAVAAST